MATKKRRPGGRLNALRDGIFAKELVIVSAGESQAEFDRLQSDFRDGFKPEDIAQELLVSELVFTQWQLQRVRRCAAAMVTKQIETAPYQKRLEKMAEVNTLKNSFFVARNRLYLEPNLPQADRVALERSLAETRRGLESTPLGVRFLIEQLEYLRTELQINGYLVPHQENLLLQVCGPEGGRVLALNRLAREERQKAQPRGDDQVKQNEGNTAAQNANLDSTLECVKLLRLFEQSNRKEVGNIQPSGPQQVEQNNGEIADQNAQRGPTAEDLGVLGALRENNQQDGNKLPQRESEPVKRDGQSTAQKKANSIVGLEKLARNRKLEQAFKGYLDARQQELKQMFSQKRTEQDEQSIADTGADPKLAALLATYQDGSQLLKEIQLREEAWAELDEPNPADENADLSLADQFAFVLSQVIKSHIEFLNRTKMQLELVEEIEEKLEPATLLLLPRECEDRIHRAETALERHFSKTLDRLIALKGLGPKKFPRE